MPHLELVGLTKRYSGVTSVDAIDLAVEHGEFICLLGPSGCGKTTTLRMIAGFLEPDARRDPRRRQGRLGAGLRGAARAAQHGHDLPELRRVAAHDGARERRLRPQDEAHAGGREARRARDAMLRATKLFELAERYPSELSGGQQQRVALARALAPKPDILLLDEPLSNLDANLRGDMRFEIRRLHDEFHNTSIYVTHDQVEAMTMADRIVVMNAGRIEQIGTPAGRLRAPAIRSSSRASSAAAT